MNSKKIIYKYTQRNLLEEPENYFFSEYNDNKFVKSYFRNRLNMIDELENRGHCKRFCNIQEYLESNKQTDIIEIPNKIVSIQFLKAILKEIIQGNIKDKKKYLEMFLKKYEVTKKIFNEYDSDFKAISSDYNNIESYCLLSICCSLYYKKTKILKYINTSIKINDMLFSKGIIIKEDNIFLACSALNEEVRCIKELFFMEGVSYEID